MWMSQGELHSMLQHDAKSSHFSYKTIAIVALTEPRTSAHGVQGRSELDLRPPEYRPEVEFCTRTSADATG